MGNLSSKLLFLLFHWKSQVRDLPTMFPLFSSISRNLFDRYPPFLLGSLFRVKCTSYRHNLMGVSLCAENYPLISVVFEDVLWLWNTFLWMMHLGNGPHVSDLPSTGLPTKKYIQYRTIHYFVIRLWGHKLVGKGNQRNHEHWPPTNDDSTTVLVDKINRGLSPVEWIKGEASF